MTTNDSAGPAGRETANARDTTRLEAFSDGVFAIAIRLLTLALDVPDVPSDDSAALGRALLTQAPDLLAYALSFAVVGRFWLIHHRFYATLEGFDSGLMTANLAYLALIVLVPFSSDLLGEYGNLSVATMIYAAVLGLAGLLNWLMIRYALRHDLVRADARAATEPFASPGALIISGVFLLSIPVALLSTTAAQLMWLGSLLSVHRQRRIGARG